MIERTRKSTYYVQLREAERGSNLIIIFLIPDQQTPTLPQECLNRARFSGMLNENYLKYSIRIFSFSKTPYEK